MARSQAESHVASSPGLSPARLEWATSSHHKAIQAPNFFYHVVRDTASPGMPEVGAAARWQLVPEGRTVEQMGSRRRKRPPSLDWRSGQCHTWTTIASRLFRIAQYKGRRDHLAGRPCLYLKTICTLPGHQRRGVGKVMMRWGMKKADELGICTYLEASPAGRRLYEQGGIVSRGHLDWDARRFEGVTCSSKRTPMLRKPAGTGEVKC